MTSVRAWPRSQTRVYGFWKFTHMLQSQSIATSKADARNQTVMWKQLKVFTGITQTPWSSSEAQQSFLNLLSSQLLSSFLSPSGCFLPNFQKKSPPASTKPLSLLSFYATLFFPILHYNSPNDQSIKPKPSPGKGVRGKKKLDERPRALGSRQQEGKSWQNPHVPAFFQKILTDT